MSPLSHPISPQSHDLTTIWSYLSTISWYHHNLTISPQSHDITTTPSYLTTISWYHHNPILSHRGGAEVAGWTLDRKIRVQFPAYPHRVWALWWQGGKRRLRTSRCPCWGRLGTLKTPSCPWRGCLAAGQNLETGHLSRHYIAEITLNVTLNHNQQQQQLSHHNLMISQP